MQDFVKDVPPPISRIQGCSNDIFCVFYLTSYHQKFYWVIILSEISQTQFHHWNVFRWKIGCKSKSLKETSTNVWKLRTSKFILLSPILNSTNQRKIVLIHRMTFKVCAGKSYLCLDVISRPQNGSLCRFPLILCHYSIRLGVMQNKHYNIVPQKWGTWSIPVWLSRA